MAIRVLIVDDVTLVRRALERALARDPAIQVVGFADSVSSALIQVQTARPDVVVLDLELNSASGLDLLGQLKRVHPKLGVVMFSSLVKPGDTRAETLPLGADALVEKPTNVHSPDQAIAHVVDHLLPRIKALAGPVRAGPSRVASHAPLPSERVKSAAAASAGGLLAIGSSTGGPNALADFVAALPTPFPLPIAIVQHMPPMFTRLLAERLSELGRLRFTEAVDGEPLVAGRGYVAPGDFHMRVALRAGRPSVVLEQTAPENSCRPAVDVLFRSVAQVYGPRTLAVVLTGMGRDGLRGCELIRAAGGHILTQDAASSVVWGMPGVVTRAGLAEASLPPAELAREIGRRAPGLRGAAAG